MSHIRFVDGKGGITADITSGILPSVGEHVELPGGKQYLVTRVMIVYNFSPVNADWLMVTVTPT